MLANGPISWRSSHQTSIVLSINEAKYIVASDAARDIIWIKCLINNIGIFPKPFRPIKFLVNNKGYKDLIKIMIFTRHMCHIDICYYYTREHADNGIINV
jgi:hypothetical protein